MSRKQDIQAALKVAMKARDEDTKRTLRLVLASIKLNEVEQGVEINNSQILGILQKEIKTRDDAIEEAIQASRQDLVEQAQREKTVLNQFLPKQLEEEELRALISDIIEKTGAKNMRDMGMVMKNLMPELEGRASGQEASRIVRELLKN